VRDHVQLADRHARRQGAGRIGITAADAFDCRYQAAQGQEGSPHVPRHHRQHQRTARSREKHQLR
jgi:hypothetical protein